MSGQRPIVLALALALSASAGVAYLLLAKEPSRTVDVSAGREETASAALASKPDVTAPVRELRDAGETADGGAPTDLFPTLDPRTPADVRSVLRYCREAGEPRIGELRRAAGQSPSPLVVGNALRALGRLHALSDIAHARDWLLDERTRVRHDLIIGLGLDGSPSGIALLERALGGDDVKARVLALQALGRIGTPDAVQLVRKALERPGLTDLEREFGEQALREAN